MSDIFLCDNAGNRVPPGVASGHPVLGSGRTINELSPVLDFTISVESGASYLIMVKDRSTSFGVEDSTIEANVLWHMPAKTIRVFTIPTGYSALHWRFFTPNATIYIVKLET